MSKGAHKFQKLVSRFPVSEDKLVGLGMQFFLSEQDPENVEFVEHPNGYSIQVKTDRQSVEDAKKFWSEYVDGKI